MPTPLTRTLLATGALGLSLLPVPAQAASAHAASTGAKHYKNCTALNKAYKHGVGKVGARDHVSGHTKPVTTFKRSNALYNANRGSDRDHDGIACEKR
ncbi:excalibur calcium-binding domain-containing protein [uncultured Jatrophihabitans sp.]|uniref:excalibur calcium-binding domain-containing protein n=1 Tax=uncultured Jatrophihabitans sp. TaxID=1610747 RepID=UPI0035CB6C14